MNYSCNHITLASKARREILMSDGLSRNFLSSHGTARIREERSNKLFERILMFVVELERQSAFKWNSFKLLAKFALHSFSYPRGQKPFTQQISSRAHNFHRIAARKWNRNFSVRFCIYMRSAHSIISRHTSNRLTTTHSAQIFFTRTIRLWNWHEQRIREQLPINRNYLNKFKTLSGKLLPLQSQPRLRDKKKEREGERRALNLFIPERVDLWDENVFRRNQFVCL